MSGFGVETIGLDLPALAVEFSAALKRADVPVGAERAVGFARALSLVRPISRARLYWTARAAFVTDRSQLAAFDSVFAAVFGFGMVRELAADERRSVATSVAPENDLRPVAERPDPVHPAADPAGSDSSPTPRVGSSERLEMLPVPVLASEEERLRAMRFDALSAEELAELYRLIARLRLVTPLRRARRRHRDRHGRHVDLRATMRASMRTGGDAVHLVRRDRRRQPRRIVLICDISGSMEPYARAYLQFLTSVAGSGIRSGGSVEAFVFATRLTRVTRALATRSPDRAIQRAAAAAPDWSGGTRIGEAMKRFNDRHGRRGMARGAVVVILSDGWERGDPAVLGRELQRLSRLAFRTVWVNPRVSAPGYAPKAAGMAAALPFIDALVGGESIAALDQVIAAIGSQRMPIPGSDWPGIGSRRPVARACEDEFEAESWASATPEPGSSVAMPSGWSPSRGRTAPGWERETS